MKNSVLFAALAAAIANMILLNAVIDKTDEIIAENQKPKPGFFEENIASLLPGIDHLATYMRPAQPEFAYYNGDFKCDDGGCVFSIKMPYADPEKMKESNWPGFSANAMKSTLGKPSIEQFGYRRPSSKQ